MASIQQKSSITAFPNAVLNTSMASPAFNKPKASHNIHITFIYSLFSLSLSLTFSLPFYIFFTWSNSSKFYINLNQVDGKLFVIKSQF